jgi:ClpX C4-type zinc finger/Sigma-70, region 4
MTLESKDALDPPAARCSFCQQSEADVGRLVEGPKVGGAASVFICADCVELCSTMLEHQKQETESGGEETAGSPDDSEALRQQIDEAVRNLSDQEFRVIELRYGLADGYYYSREEVASLLEIPLEEVEEIEAGAVAKLQAAGE